MLSSFVVTVGGGGETTNVGVVGETVGLTVGDVGVTVGDTVGEVGGGAYVGDAGDIVGETVGLTVGEVVGVLTSW